MTATRPERTTPAAANRAEVRATVARALNTLAGPGRPDLTHHEDRLRAHATALLPAAEAAVDQLGHGSLTWWLRRERLGLVRDLLAQPPVDEPLAAHGRVFHLAHDCQLLLTYLEETP